jgi:hypothetical protein
VAAAGVARVVCGLDEGGVFHRPEDVIEMLESFGVKVEAYGG